MAATPGPFKFLDAYTREDRDVFFGRDREIDELYQKVFESRLLLLYGISGTGKTSLINCGLANKFEESDWLPINVRRGKDINESLFQEVREESLTELKDNTPIQEAIQSLYLDHFKPVYIIFDQFEELFIFGDRHERDQFIESISILLQAELQCRFLFSIREEYLASVTEFESQIPEFLSNRMRIEKMTRLQARDVIQGPCRVNGIETEDGFADALLTKLSPESNEIELTYLQVFLDRILRLSGDSRSFTLKQIEDSGDVSDLLGSFLEEQISQLEDPDTGLVVLKSFVSMKGTKKQIGTDEIKDFARTLGTPLEKKQLTDLLQRFVNLRVLKEKDEYGQYELRHDSLAVKIYEKITLVEKELLEIKDFLENAYSNYQRREILLSEVDLKYIAPYEDKLFLSKTLHQFIAASRKETVRRFRRRRRMIAAAVITLIIILTFFTGWAMKERGTALDQTKIATSQRQAAITSRDEAIEARNEADQARNEAEQSEKNALEQQVIAEDARADAEKQRVIAVDQRNRAEDLYGEATEQRRIAQSAQKRAEDSREEVLEANKLANFHLYIFNGKELANKSRLLQEDDSLKALLALTAYELIKFGYDQFAPPGEEIEYDPEILESLQQALLAFESDSVYGGEILEMDYSGSVLSFSDRPGHFVWMDPETDPKTGIPVLSVSGSRDLPDPSFVSAVRSDPYSHRTLFGTFGGNVIVWEGINHDPEIVYNHKNNRVLSVAFIPGHDYIVSTSVDKTLIIWDLESKEMVNRIELSAVPLDLEVIGPGMILTSDKEGKILQWKTDDMENPRVLWDTGGKAIYSLAFSKAHQMLVAGSDGRTMVFYFDMDAQVPVPLNSFTIQHKGVVSNLQFSGDDRWLVSTGWDGLVLLWDLKDTEKNRLDRVVPVVISNELRIFSLCCDSKSHFIFYGDSKYLHRRNIDVELTYNHLRSIIGKRSLDESEWDYYIKGDLVRPGEALQASSKQIPRK